MNKIHLLTIIILVVCLSAFGYYIFTYNQEFQDQTSEQNKNIESMKQKQQNLDEQFLREQQEKERNLQQIETSKQLKDEDGDGLTYEQEVALGTSDNERDSDGDGIDDNEDKHPAGGGQNYKFTVVWTHNGLEYTTQFGIAEDKYWYYKNQERGYCCNGWDEFATPYDPTIQTIAKDITDVSISTGDSCKVCIAIDFVQSMIYQLDVEYNKRDEYPKYPIETIVDGKGDCEDTSFLMASVLEAIGIDTVLFNLPGHFAVGIYCNTCTGEYHLHNGRKYYFLETTGYADMWEIGRTNYNLNEELEGVIDVG